MDTDILFVSDDLCYQNEHRHILSPANDDRSSRDSLSPQPNRYRSYATEAIKYT